MSDACLNTDEICWSLLMDGDKESLVKLYNRYYHVLLFIGLKNVADVGLVKDVIQQQFLYFWEKRASLSEAKNVRSYIIMSFLRRLTSDWVRFRKTKKLEVAWSKKEEVVFEKSWQERIIEKEHDETTRKNFIDIINTLPARQRELVWLRFYEGLNYDEIAHKTGLAHKTIYNKIYEALVQIRAGYPGSQGRSGYQQTLLLLIFLHFLLH